MQASHVAAGRGDAHQLGSMIDHVFQLGCVEHQFAHQVDQNARVEIAASSQFGTGALG